MSISSSSSIPHDQHQHEHGLEVREQAPGGNERFAKPAEVTFNSLLGTPAGCRVPGT